ncbi:hypothetical protein [Paenibacillus xerothermodurans]|uniref:hypothetical protein n=1 Tax=Paenibacillus xerothermodurans TaxID=1977292 RepID=UPI0014030690|nr:hypothetical protein [Paenibacillus xerothermodurans]
MNKNENGMLKSDNVDQQLDQLEEQNASDTRNKEGSTNEIQPMGVDEGVTQ